MRTYPQNSPEAAARLVALALIADGVASAKEFAALDAARACASLGLTSKQWGDVLRDLCEDLLNCQTRQWGRACNLDDHMLDAMLDEVDDPALRERALALAVMVAEADGHLGDAEGRVLARAAARWQVYTVMLMPGAPLARAA